MVFRIQVVLVASVAALLVLLLPTRAIAKTVKVDCGATRVIGSIVPAKRVVFKIANLGECCAQIILYDAPDQGGNVVLDVTLCPNERLNVDRPDLLAASARLVGGDGSGQASLDFVALPPDDDANWARNGDNIFSTNAANVGIGTTTPGEKLTVCGTIESKSGGVKFPDGSIQTTAAAGPRFTDVQMYSGTALSWTQIDVSAVVGRRQALLLLAVRGVSGITSSLAFRPAGHDRIEVSDGPTIITTGANVVRVREGYGTYVWVRTNDHGVIEVLCDQGLFFDVFLEIYM